MADTIDSFNIGHHFYADNSKLLTHMSLTAVSQHCRWLELCVEHLNDRCWSRTLATGAHLEDFNWIKIRRSLSGSTPKNRSLPTSNNSTEISISVPSSSNRPTPSVICTSSLTASCQCIGTLANCRQVAFSHPMPTSVPVDAQSIIAMTRFCIHPITHRLLQCRACWPASLHACTSSACNEGSRAVRRRSASACSHHWNQAVATLVTVRLSDSLQDLSYDVHCL